MNDALTEIRIRAEILHRRACSGHPAALQRFRGVRAEGSSTIRRADCLSALAHEMGFANWPEAKQVLSGHTGPNGGDLLCPKRCAAHLNQWYRSRDQAVAARNSGGGYLLVYRRQYLVVEGEYIRTLGLDPSDRDWTTLGMDWTREDSGDGECVAARARLLAKLVAAMPREQ